MNQRIRYIKSATGYTSMKVLKSRDGTEYRPMLFDGMLSGSVLKTDGTTVTTVTGSSHHKTKIALKKALESLGVEFMPEGRTRKKLDEA